MQIRAKKNLFSNNIVMWLAFIINPMPGATVSDSIYHKLLLEVLSSTHWFISVWSFRATNDVL